MVELVCLRCGYKTKYRHRLKTHLERKIICQDIIEDITPSEVANKYSINITSEKVLPNAPNCSQMALSGSQTALSGSQTALSGSQMALFGSQTAPEWSDLALCGSQKNKSLGSCIKMKEPKKNKAYYCIYCNYQFNKKGNLNRHYNTCKEKRVKDKNGQITNDQENNNNCNEEKYTLIQNNYNCSNNSNNFSNNSIIINNYGKEDLSYLTNSDLTNYVKNLPPGVIKFIEKVHFHPQHPENRNLRITNKKESLIQVRKKNKWMFEDKMITINNLLSEKYQLLENHLSELGENDITNKDKRVIERFRNNYEDNVGYVKDILKKIELLILNNSK